MDNSKKKKPIGVEGGLRTPAEKEVIKDLAHAFSLSPDSIEVKLDNFPKYMRRQRLTRLFALYELFKQILTVKGSIIVCGVYRGFDLMSFAQMSAMLEPNNLTRRIYGFDTFQGFPSISKKDQGGKGALKKGQLNAASFEELEELIRIYNNNRSLGHISKVELVKGEAEKTIPLFIKKNPHLVVSLLFCDFDLYEPTRSAIKHIYPRMPKGSIIAFDELDNPLWPGETLALLETIGIKNLQLKRFSFDPYIGYAVI